MIVEEFFFLRRFLAEIYKDFDSISFFIIVRDIFGSFSLYLVGSAHFLL